MFFSNMTGYEFEDFISKLLARIGFTVTQTAYSHDGGIDLLATYEKPLFSGKYIVQCKNYSGLVGQPEVRDLYGVVMSENANKGILITPSDYTEQAYLFAKGKNLELINGTVLNNLIAEHMGNSPVAEEDTLAGFNIEQYNYLMQCIDNDPTSPKFYLKALDFLRNSIIEDAPFVKVANVFDKIIDLNTRLMKRCYKSKADIYFKKACWYRIAEIEIIRGNLGAATNILLDNDWFYIKDWLPAWRVLGAHGPLGDPTKYDDIFEPYSRCTLARNLYAALKGISHTPACREIIKKTDISAEIDKKHQQHFYIYGTRGERDSIDEIIKCSADEYHSFLSGKLDDVFIYSAPIPDKKTLRYQKTASDIRGTISQTQKYYSRSHDTIINEVNMAFKQHGITISSKDGFSFDF